MSRTWGFADRREAGRVLAARVEHLRGQHPVVLGLPRGGVPVAAVVAPAMVVLPSSRARRSPSTKCFPSPLLSSVGPLFLYC